MAEDYKALRQAAYPPMADFVDAIVHQHMGEAGAMEVYVEKCLEVKKKYPKPEVSEGE